MKFTTQLVGSGRDISDHAEVPQEVLELKAMVETQLPEHDRLRVVQRMNFPGLFPPNHPRRKEEVGTQYGVGVHVPGGSVYIAHDDSETPAERFVRLKEIVELIQGLSSPDPLIAETSLKRLGAIREVENKKFDKARERERERESALR